MHILETDVRIVKDGKIIVCHDENFLRLCGISHLVKDIESHKLPKFTDDLPLHFSKNQFYKCKAEDQRVYSTLEEVFQQIDKNVAMQIDLKDKGNLDEKKEVIRLIRKYNREKTTVIGGEREADTTVMHQIAPEIPKFISADYCYKLLLAYYLGFLPFMRINNDVFAVPYMTTDYLKMKLIEG